MIYIEGMGVWISHIEEQMSNQTLAQSISGHIYFTVFTSFRFPSCLTNLLVTDHHPIVVMYSGACIGLWPILV